MSTITMTCPDLSPSETSGRCNSSSNCSSNCSSREFLHPAPQSPTNDNEQLQQLQHRHQATRSVSTSGSILDPSARSLNGHGICCREDISESFRRDDPDTVTVAAAAATTSSIRVPWQDAGNDDDDDSCFFPHHQPLQGDFPQKVVRYAYRRLRKAKLSTSVLSGSILPSLTHSCLELDKLLGEGSFSSVYSLKSLSVDDQNDFSTSTATSTTTSKQDNGLQLPPHQDLVVKVLRKKLLKNPPMLAACAADLIKEGAILAQLSSQEHILTIHAWGSSGSKNGNGIDSFGNGRHDAFFLVLGKLKTTLGEKFVAWRQLAHHCRGWTMLQSKRVLQCKMTSLQERLAVVEPLLKAVTYMHSQNILHRDLKPDNLGFDANGVLKVFDFDVARALPCRVGTAATADAGCGSADSTNGGGSYSSSNSNPINSPSSADATFQMTKRVGSPRYMSPECARGDPYNTKADVYSVALLIHELISLEKPYEDVPSELHDELVFYQGARPYLPPTWPTPVQQGLEQGWSECISERPTASQLLNQWREEWHALVLQDKQRKYRNPFGNSKVAKTKEEEREDQVVFSSSESTSLESTPGSELMTTASNPLNRRW